MFFKQAMIMAAGLGTRLKPLTLSTPKALVSYKGQPLLDHILKSLINAGFERIVINIHHFGDQIINFISQYEYKGCELIISDERSLLLDTGGGIKKAFSFFENSPVLIHNVDIITSAKLNEFWVNNETTPHSASLMVKDRQTSRNLLFNQNLLLCGWENNTTGERIISRNEPDMIKLAFSGIYILSESFINELPERKVYPVMPEILHQAWKSDIYGYRHDSDEWKDMGKPEAYN